MEKEKKRWRIIPKRFIKTDHIAFTKAIPEREEIVPVKDVMTKDVVTLSANSNIQEAARLMARHHIRGLVIASPAGVVEGLVTDRDIVEKVAVKGGNVKAKISTIMIPQQQLITARPDEDLITISKRMRVSGVGRLPIVDENGKLQGIVTETDLTRVYPGLIEILYEELAENEPLVPERESMAGRCERCGAFSEFLVQTGEEWLCDECGAEYTGEKAKR